METARRQYAAGRKQHCYRRLLELLRVDPTIWLRNNYFVDAVFADVGRLHELNALLGAALKKYPGFHFSQADYDPARIAIVQKQREAALGRNVPPVLIICQHKSGSEAIHAHLAERLELPTMRISLQTMPTDEVVQSWAADFARGGCLGGPHLDPTPDNLKKLARAKLRKFVVHVRDPRQSLLSQTHYVKTVRENGSEERLIYREFSDQSKDLTQRIDECLDRYLDHTVSWVENWLKAAEQFEILFTTYEQFRFDARRFYARISSFFDLPAVSGDDRETIGKHFRSGRTDEWARVLTPEQNERCNARLSVDLLRRFHWPEPMHALSIGKRNKPGGSPKGLAAAHASVAIDS